MNRSGFFHSLKIFVSLYILIVFLFQIPAFAQKKIGPTPPDLRLKWYDEHVALKDKSLFKCLEWRFIGPEIMSGRITDVAIPHDKNHTIYIAAASGGIWKTENQGTTWESIFEHAPSTSIGDIAIAESNTGIIWAGLGEANIFRSSYSGTGVYKSIDGGKTWKHMGLTDTQHIARIIIHPANPDIVYVAASGHEYSYNKERGVFKTTNGGKTWDKILYINEKTGAVDLVMHPEDTNILYASMWDRIRHAWNDPKPGEEDGIYKTTDGGKNWEKLTNGLPNLKLVGRIGIDIAKSNPDVIYALMDNHNPGREPEKGELDAYGRPRQQVITGADVYRSDNGGKNWKKVSPLNRMMEGLFSTYGWVFGQIRVDPNDEDTIYILGVPLMKSTDGGKSFEELDYSGLHVDHHALWIDPTNSNYLVNGNDGGLNISYDGGETWVNYETPGIVQFYNVAVDYAKPFNVYGSIQDNGTFMGPVTHRPGIEPKYQWKSIPGGEASYIEIDPSDPDILYSESFYGRIQRSEWKNGRWDTKRIFPRAAEGEPPLRGNWLAPFILSPHNPHIIYHGMQYLYRSLNSGENFEKISPDLTYNDPEKQGDISYATITTISESPFKFGLIYVGTDDGKVWVTKNGGFDWNEIIKGLPYKKWVSRILASEYDESTVYVSLNGYRDDDFAAYLYMSQDYGKTWKDIKNDIPCGPVNVIKEDPKNENILYAGTDLGVYVSIDKGKTWNTLHNNIPTTFVHDVIVHPRDNILVAGTHGRGVFTMDVNILQKMDEEILKKDAHIFDIESVTLPWNLRFRRYFPGNVKIYYFLNDKKDIDITINDESGKKITELDGTFYRGLNSVEWDMTADEKLVKAGKYTVEIKADGKKYEKEFELKPARRFR